MAELLQSPRGDHLGRRADQLSQRRLEYLSNRLAEAGWTGENLFDLVRTEMASLLGFPAWGKPIRPFRDARLLSQRDGGRDQSELPKPLSANGPERNGEEIPGGIWTSNNSSMPETK